MQSVYIETSVISYLTAKASRDVVTIARQTLTQDWWQTQKPALQAYISVVVLDEASKGDQVAADKRLNAIADLPVLDITQDAETLAQQLIAQKLLPAHSLEDALHIAIAATHNIEHLVTWNFKHINNTQMRSRVYDAVKAAGYYCPMLCSPEELKGVTS